MSVMNVPNTLTIIRIILIPVFVTAIIYKRYDYALCLFGIAAISDLLDGFIARITAQKTAFGSFLDPLADKFLLITSFILLSIYGLIPSWLTITIISRDIIVVTGWVALYIITHTRKIETLAMGKVAIASQLILIFYVLLNINIPSLPDVQEYLQWLTAIFTIISGLHYIYRGFKQSNA